MSRSQFDTRPGTTRAAKCPTCGRIVVLDFAPAAIATDLTPFVFPTHSAGRGYMPARPIVACSAAGLPMTHSETWDESDG